MAYAGDEKRRHKRYTLSLGASLGADSGELPCTIRDFSSRGMLVHLADEAHCVAEPLAPGQKVTLSFELSPQHGRARAAALIVRALLEDASRRIAVCFARCNPMVLDALLRLAEEQGGRSTLAVVRSSPVAARSPTEHELVRVVSGVQSARVMVETMHGALLGLTVDNERRKTEHFYALMAFQGLQQQIEEGLARLLAEQPPSTLDTSSIVNAVQRICRSSSMASEAQAAFLDTVENCAATCLEKASAAA